MKEKLNITVITGTRADYGIYTPLLERLENDSFFDMNLLVTGMHLSPIYGATINEIVKDGYKIGATVDMLLQGDTSANMAKSIGIGILGMTQAFESLKPDLVVVLGDRGEMLAAAISAAHLNIPVAHLHGGEVSGSIDESVRHAISKFSHLHFVSSDESEQRLIKMGEDPWRVFSVGALRLDTILNSKVPSLEQVKEKYNLDITDYYLMIYHPVTTEQDTIEQQISNVLKALLDEDKDIVCIAPNSDAGNESIQKIYKEYSNNPRFHLITNFSHIDYLCVLKNCIALVGNSSSGIIEAASYKKPVLNIGSRQNGRERSENVLDVSTSLETIKNGLKQINSQQYKEKLENIINVYGDGKSSGKIIEVLKKMEINEQLLKKKITY